MATQQFIIGSPMDEMIQLFHAGRIQGPQFPARGMRHVFFNDLGEIAVLLDPTSQSTYLQSEMGRYLPPGDDSRRSHIVEAQTVISNIRMDTSSCVKPTSGNNDNNAMNTVDQDMNGSVEVEEDEYERLELDPAMNAELLTHSMESYDAAIGPSEEQIKAAVTVQTRYRSIVSRRRGIRNTLADVRSRLFMECYTESGNIDWQHKGQRAPHYRHFFLGPLPHLLLCLEQAKTFAYESKNKAKRHLSEGGHQELEAVQTKMMDAKWVYLNESVDVSTD
jgi:hypothetical protein